MNKAELISELQKEEQNWQAFLDQIDPTHLDQPGVNGDWSIKDLVAHLTGWQYRLITHIQAAQRNEPEPPSPWPAHIQTEDETNAWIYESNRARSVRDVLNDSRHVFQQLLAVMEELSADGRFETVTSGGKNYHVVWVGDKRFAPGEFFYHFRDDHEADVRAWLARLEKL